MTIYKQPDTEPFASSAPESEITTFTAWLRGLGIAFDETNGFPEMTGINDVLNRLSQGIKYLEQIGISPWRSDMEYPVNATVMYSGKLYKCLSQNTNKQPDQSQNEWTALLVDSLTSTSDSLGLTANQGRVLDLGKVSKKDLVDNLTSDATWTAPTANQVRILNQALTTLQTQVNNLVEFKSGANGYIRIGSYYEQWGVMNYDTIPGEIQVTITFPKPFPNACTNLVASRIMPKHTSNGDGGINIISLSKDQAVVSLQTFNTANSGDVRGFYWTAKGN